MAVCLSVHLSRGPSSHTLIRRDLMWFFAKLPNFVPCFKSAYSCHVTTKSGYATAFQIVILLLTNWEHSQSRFFYKLVNYVCAQSVQQSLCLHHQQPQLHTAHFHCHHSQNEFRAVCRLAMHPLSGGNLSTRHRTSISSSAPILVTNLNTGPYVEGLSCHRTRRNWKIGMIH